MVPATTLSSVICNRPIIFCRQAGRQAGQRQACHGGSCTPGQPTQTRAWEDATSTSHTGKPGGVHTLRSSIPIFWCSCRSCRRASFSSCFSCSSMRARRAAKRRGCNEKKSVEHRLRQSPGGKCESGGGRTREPWPRQGVLVRHPVRVGLAKLKPVRVGLAKLRSARGISLGISDSMHSVPRTAA